MANLTGAPSAAPFPTSVVKTTSEHGGAGLGQRFSDKDGNEFILVDCQEAMLAGEVVVIGPDWNASQITSTSRGRVGVVCAATSASDTYAFVQVYGTFSGALCTSGVTSAGLLFAPVTTDAGAFDQGTTTTGNTIHGAWSRTAASTATSPGGFVLALTDVQLNYPFVLGVADAILMTS